jgi:hypothetical protein
MRLQPQPRAHARVQAVLAYLQDSGRLKEGAAIKSAVQAAGAAADATAAASGRPAATMPVTHSLPRLRQD